MICKDHIDNELCCGDACLSIYDDDLYRQKDTLYEFEFPLSTDTGTVEEDVTRLWLGGKPKSVSFPWLVVKISQKNYDGHAGHKIFVMATTGETGWAFSRNVVKL